MDETCPEHLEGLYEILKDLSKYDIQYLDDLNEYTFAHEIKCTCLNKEFIIYKDGHPTVIAECNCCGKRITVYDLDFYPAATKIKEKLPMERYLSENGDELFNICVLYEYSDEFEYEDDVEFDRNDISWCVIYGYGLKSKKIFQIINDETS